MDIDTLSPNDVSFHSDTFDWPHHGGYLSWPTAILLVLLLIVLLAVVVYYYRRHQSQKDTPDLHHDGCCPSPLPMDSKEMSIFGRLRSSLRKSGEKPSSEEKRDEED